MRLAMVIGSFCLLFNAKAARAGDSNGEVVVSGAGLTKVRALEAALKDAENQATQVRIAQFLAVLPLSQADTQRMDSAYSNGLDAGCPSAACELNGAGVAARAPLDYSNDASLRGVDVGIRANISGAFKISSTDAGEVFSVCGIEGVYFARSIFRKNLINFQFVDNGGETIVAKYELTGGESGSIRCD